MSRWNYDRRRDIFFHPSGASITTEELLRLPERNRPPQLRTEENIMETRRIQQGEARTKYEDELFAGFKQAVGQEIFDFLKSSERYKRVKVDFENIGPMGGKSVNISGWATDNNGNAVIPFALNVYCDSMVYERMKSELLEAQEFARSQEDIKKFLTDE